MSVSAYHSYRDTGFDWLGAIPVGWQAIALRYLADCCDGQRIPLNATERAERPGDVPYWGANAIMGYVDQPIFDEELVLLGEDGAPFFDRTKPVAFRSIGPVWPNNHIHVLRPKLGLSAAFLTYALNTTEYAPFIDGSTRDKLTQASMMSIPVATPSSAEQVSIVAFLDRETGKIDALVAAQRRLIELLKEKRQAVISKAVIKGLDPTAPMNDSGVEWLGEVPAHWQVRPLKHLVTLRSGSTPSKDRLDYWSGEVPWASAKDLKSDELQTTQDFLSQSAIDEGAAATVPIGSVIVLVRGMMLARTFPVCRTLVPMAINQDLKAITGRPSVSNRYLTWMLRGTARETLNRLDEAGHGTKALRMETWLSMLVPWPPLREQELVVEAVEQSTRQIDRLIKEADAAITLLNERRSSIISAAVTGKIDVRGLVAIEILPKNEPADKVAARKLVGSAVLELVSDRADGGRVKAQKLIYLAEAHAGVRELAGQYLRMAAGPFDGELIREAESQLENDGQVAVEQPAGPGGPVLYKVIGPRGRFRVALDQLLGDRKPTFDKTLRDVATLDTRGAEAVATLYAVWNDMLLAGDDPTDDLIISGFLDDWHPEKRVKFKDADLRIWLGWMRRHALVPRGQGPRTTTGRLFV